MLTWGRADGGGGGGGAGCVQKAKRVTLVLLFIYHCGMRGFGLGPTGMPGLVGWVRVLFWAGLEPNGHSFFVSLPFAYLDACLLGTIPI